MASLSKINQLRRGRSYLESGKEHWTEHRRGVRSIGVVEERRKKKRLEKNKIKEENR
jgi:flagellar biosynthesis chaperone FliJ